MFFFVCQPALGQGCFQLFLLLAAGLLRGLQLLLTLTKRQQATVQRRKLLAQRASGGVLRQAGGNLVGIQRQRRRRQLRKLASGFRQALLHGVLLLGIARLLLEDGPPARQRVSPLAIAIVFFKPQVEGVMGIL